MVKLGASVSDILYAITYLTGEYGVPSTQYGKEMFAVNLANIIANRNFIIYNISDLERNLGNSKYGVKNRLGNDFYAYISEVSKTGKIDNSLPDLVKANRLYELLVVWEKEHILNTDHNNHSEDFIQKQVVNNMTDALITSELQETDQEICTEQSEHQDIQEGYESNSLDNEDCSIETNTGIQGELGMGLEKADSLELLLELFRRAAEASKLKSLDVTLSNDTIDNLANALAESLANKQEECDIPEKYSWNTISKQLPTLKQVYGVNMDEVKQSLSSKKALIIEGVPGTGKSVLLFNLIHELSENDPSRFKVVSFSQTTSYSEFIEGIRNVNGSWEYTDGTFLSFCKLVDSDREHNYYFGIDEISRGNTESIFGEVMTAMESRDTIITLQSGNSIVVPSNLYIIGTMNTLDRSSKIIDRATADRFSHVRLEPQWKYEYILHISKYNGIVNDEQRLVLEEKLKELCQIMTEVNERITSDSLSGYDNVIGTRALSIPDITLDKLRLAIQTSIIPEIRNKRTMCSKSTSESLEEQIKKLSKI